MQRQTAPRPGARSDLFRTPPRSPPPPPPRSPAPRSAGRPPRRRRSGGNQAPLAIALLVVVVALAMVFVLSRTQPPSQRIGQEWVDVIVPIYTGPTPLNTAERQRIADFLRQRHPEWLAQAAPVPGREKPAMNRYRRLAAQAVADDPGLHEIYARHGIAFLIDGVMIGQLHEPPATPAPERPAVAPRPAPRPAAAAPAAPPRPAAEPTAEEPAPEPVQVQPAPAPARGLEAAL